MKNKKDEYEFDKIDLGVEFRKFKRAMLITDLILPIVIAVLTLIGYHLI